MTKEKKQKETKFESVSESRERNNKGVATSLIADLASYNDAKRVKARHSLVAMGKATVPLLTEALKSPNSLEDAYLRETVIHNVWVIKHSSTEVTVYSPICPHLGYHYDWHPTQSEFICPCHGSVYAIDGKVLGGPAPRPLDTLPTILEKGELFIEWETFKVGIPEKVPV